MKKCEKSLQDTGSLDLAPNMPEVLLRTLQRFVVVAAPIVSAFVPDSSLWVPLIGNLTYEQLSSVVSDMSEKRLMEALRGVKSQVDLLPKEVVESEYFLDATLKTINNVLTESEFEKRQCFGNLYKNFLKKQKDSSVQKVYREFDYWSMLLKKLSYPTFYVLMEIVKRDQNKDPVTYLNEADFFESLAEVAPAMYMRAHILIELEREGFIASVNSLNPDDIKYGDLSKKRFNVNPVANDFLNWLNHASDAE
jgi:hypothetical protein